MKASCFDIIATLKARIAPVPDQYGVVDPGSAPGRTVRLHSVDTVAEQQQHGSGILTGTVRTVQLRYAAGIAVGDTLIISSTLFEIVEIKELGRRAYLQMKLVERP